LVDENQGRLEIKKLGAETTLSFLDLNFDPPILVGK
jgi:hypothetical protein